MVSSNSDPPLGVHEHEHVPAPADPPPDEPLLLEAGALYRAPTILPKVGHLSWPKWALHSSTVQSDCAIFCTVSSNSDPPLGVHEHKHVPAPLDPPPDVPPGEPPPDVPPLPGHAYGVVAVHRPSDDEEVEVPPVTSVPCFEQQSPPVVTPEQSH